MRNGTLLSLLGPETMMARNETAKRFAVKLARCAMKKLRAAAAYWQEAPCGQHVSATPHKTYQSDFASNAAFALAEDHSAASSKYSGILRWCLAQNACIAAAP